MSLTLNHERPTAPPRPAATVVLLRDGDTGLEIFLVERHGLSDVLGGAYVFPGGKLDSADAEVHGLGCVHGSLEALHAALGEPTLDPEAAAALHVAACRETFEESGVLLAAGAGPDDAARLHAMLREGFGFAEAMKSLGLMLDCSNLVPWSRWITPVVPSVMTKRFDTRFFVAALPEGQVARHDDHEATGSVWLAPRAALDRYWAREVMLAPPQIMTLAHLTRFGSTQAVLDEARSRPPAVIQPEPWDHEGARVVAYPGDERHPLSARAMPGPTRLVFREGRFEPFDGYEAFFAD